MISFMIYILNWYNRGQEGNLGYQLPQMLLEKKQNMCYANFFSLDEDSQDLDGYSR